MHGRPPTALSLRACLAAALVALASSCVDGSGPTGGGWRVPLDLQPRFQVDLDLFPSAPIDRIRLTATALETQQIVGQADISVSPSEPEWELSLAIDLGGAPSLDILVDVELLSGENVEWSGRLGPIAVERNGTPEVRVVDVHRGPLENLDVLALDLQGAPTQMTAGASTTLSAQPTLPPGSETSPTVFWATTDAAVATVTGTGPTATLTAVAPGTVNVIATAGSAHDEVTVVVIEVAPPGDDVEWQGTTTDWFDAANWSTSAVPGATDNVFIAVAAAYPQVTTDIEVASLSLAPTATLTLSNATLELTGSLVASGAILGTGSILLWGDGIFVSGTTEPPINILGTATADGPITTDFFTITGTDGNFDIAGQTIVVERALQTLDSGALRMSAGSLSTVDAVFEGGSTEGLLTGGTLSVSGNFEATTSPLSFAASGTHTVVLDGTDAQTISLSNAGAGQQRFANLTVDNTDGVMVGSDLHVSGTLEVARGILDLGTSAVNVSGQTDVNGTLIVPSGGSLTIGGTLVLAEGSTLTVDGSVSAQGCENGGATITGTGTFPTGCSPQPVGGTRTWIEPVDGDWDDPTNWVEGVVPTAVNDVVIPGGTGTVEVSGDVTVASLEMGVEAFIDLNGFTLTVNGEISQDADAGIAGGLVVIAGPGTTLSGTYDQLELRADRTHDGPLMVNGSLTLADADLVVGPYMLTVNENLSVSGDGAHLVMTDPAVNVSVRGDALFDGGDHSGLLTAGELWVYGDFTVSARTPTSFAADPPHGLLLGALYRDQTVTFASPGPTQQRLGDLTLLKGDGYRVSFATDAHVLGDVSSHPWFVVGPTANVTIDGTLRLETESILQVDATASLTAASCTASSTVVIIGAGEQQCGTSTVVDRIWLGGEVSAPNAWETDANWEPGVAPTSGDVVLVPQRVDLPQVSTDASVAGLIVQYSTVELLGGARMTVSGDIYGSGSVTGGEVEVVGPGTRLDVDFDDLRISSARILSDRLWVNGNLYLEAPLHLGPETASVQGDLLVSGTGVLEMQDPSSYVGVDGNVVFNGASEDGLLTAGTLRVQGDFTALCQTDPSCFVSTGTVVEFYTPTGDQVVTLSSPFVQRFQDLGVYTNGALILQDTVFVDGNLSTASLLTSNTTIRSDLPNLVMEVQGRIITSTATTTTFDGLPLRIVNSVNGPTPGEHTMIAMSFINMPAGTAQLYLQMAGAGTGEPLRIDTPTFDESSGTAYLQIFNTTLDGQVLRIEVSSPTPADAGDMVGIVGGPVDLVWPFP